MTSLDKREKGIQLKWMTVALFSVFGTLSLNIASAAGDGTPTGTTEIPAGWAPGKVRMDYWKFKYEKPVATISGSNVSQFADKLSPGQLALFKANPNYQMIVYPTHRDCGYPDWLLKNGLANKSQIGRA